MTDWQDFKDQLRSVGVWCGDLSNVVEIVPESELECALESIEHDGSAFTATSCGAAGPKKIVFVSDGAVGKASAFHLTAL